MYTQCKLKKGSNIQFCWIPEKFAIVGKFLKLKKDIGWEVLEIYKSKDENYVLSNERNYKIHRKATDI